MTEQPRQRVRVTGPARRRPAAARSRAGEIDAGSALGAVYLSSLLREQRRLAARVLGAVLALVGTLPLLFHLLPGLADVSVLGVPLSWLLLALAVHPLLWLLGWVYVREAETNEDDFAALIGEASDDVGDGGHPADHRR